MWCVYYLINFNDERKMKLNDCIIELDRRRVFLHWLYTIFRSRSIEKYITSRVILGSPLNRSYLHNVKTQIIWAFYNDTPTFKEGKQWIHIGMLTDDDERRQTTNDTWYTMDHLYIILHEYRQRLFNVIS